MVLHKRLDYGSSGHRIPAMPAVPRSAKGKRSVRKKVDANQMCAFDLLATVAGSLLETENSTSLINHATEKDIKQERLDKGKSPEAEVFDPRSFSRSALGSEGFFPNSSKDDTHTSDTVLEHIGHSLGTAIGRRSIERGSPDSVESSKYKPDEVIKMPLRAESLNLIPGSRGSESLMYLDTKPPALVSSDSSVEIPLCGNHIGNSSIPMLGEHMERDDDENSSGCTHPSTMPSKAFKPQRIGDRRIRKLLGSKYWNAPIVVKDEEFSDTETKPVYRGKRIGLTRQRAQRSSYKRRKLSEHRVISASDRGMYSEGTSNSPVKGSIKLEATGSHDMNGVSGESSAADQKSSSESGDHRVKFSVKSFKVPELFIEIPENATVGSLKKTVMEAVTAILGGGLRVGVLLQGKKVRDDNKTLIQAGISHDNNTENLGFTLEPNPTRAPAMLAKSDDFFPCETTKQLIRLPAVVPQLDGGTSTADLQPPLTAYVKCYESDTDSAHSNSKALVPLPAMSVDALAVVPLRKSRRAELAQRRIRRPFSVTEVEALVQAVEKLGTGRWRDVKIRAFDNAKHRTYVDLKDKWKTLVHTARISPQQRRGEPVPQILLDRVLAAHAFWSQQQAKLQLKSEPAEACLMF